MKIRADSRPLYVRAEEALKELLGQTYHAGDQLPPEPQLADELGISRSTLREAMRSFEERGLISRRQGVGTFVREKSVSPVIESGLESLESLDSLARRKGLNISDRNVRIEAGVADDEISEHLQVATGASMVVAIRTKVADGRPVAHMVDMVPTSIVALDELRAGFHGSVLDFLLGRGSPSLSYAWARMVAMTAGPHLSDEMEVSPHSALLLFEETLYSVGNQPAGFSRNYFIPDFFEFHVIRRIGT